MTQTSLTPCPFWAEKLAAGHPDDLAPVERMALERHLASCPACSAVRAQYEDFWRQLRQLPAVAPPPLPPRLLQMWQAQDSHQAAIPALAMDEQAGHSVSSASRPIPTRKPASKLRVLIQAIAAILILGLLLGGALVIFAYYHTEATKTGSAPHLAGWQLVSSPNAGSAQNALKAVAVVSPNDVWAVGYSANTSLNTSNTDQPVMPPMGQALIEHWNGTRWSIVPNPDPGASNYNLNAVAAISSNDVWAVGDSSNGGDHPERALIEHWNGKQWQVVPGPNPGSYENFLTGIAAISTNDVWVVGGFASTDEATNTLIEHTLVEHWNGSQWSVIPSPNPGPIQQYNGGGSMSVNYLNGVTAISPDDVWAVGSFATNNAGKTLVERWNGKQWSVVSSPNLGLFEDKLNAVAGVSANDVWAVGGSYYFNYSTRHFQTLIEHWNGSQWSVVDSINISYANENYLFGVVAISANDVWAVGHSTQTYPQQGPALIEHWNGNRWSIVKGQNAGPYNNTLVGLARVPGSSQIWAVGYSGEGNAPERTMTEIWK